MKDFLLSDIIYPTIQKWFYSKVRTNLLCWQRYFQWPGYSAFCSFHFHLRGNLSWIQSYPIYRKTVKIWFLVHVYWRGIPDWWFLSNFLRIHLAISYQPHFAPWSMFLLLNQIHLCLNSSAFPSQTILRRLQFFHQHDQH